MRNRLNKVFGNHSVKMCRFYSNGDYDHLTTIPKIKELAQDEDFGYNFVIVEEPSLKEITKSLLIILPESRLATIIVMTNSRLNMKTTQKNK